VCTQCNLTDSHPLVRVADSLKLPILGNAGVDKFRGTKPFGVGQLEWAGLNELALVRCVDIYLEVRDKTGILILMV
jgi:hypothetical protein